MAYRPHPPPGLYKRPVFEPQCTHLTMTRLYDQTAICCNCHRPGPFGWVYQCTQDREEVLEQAAARGELTAFDDLGRMLGARLRIRKRSPAARQDSLSFFKEITSEQMSKYTPQQIALILRQRETVHLAIESDRIRINTANILNQAGRHDLNGTSANGYSYHPPWVRSAAEECHYWVCPNCRPGAADRAFLSLDAVAEGEITPTAAVGYGFHVLGERPIVNANVVKEIGCRPVPNPCYDSNSDCSSFGSDLSVMELLDHQIARGQIHYTNRYPRDTGADDDNTQLLLPRSEKDSIGQLKHSPRCDNLADSSERNVLIRRWPFERPPKESSFPAFVHHDTASEKPVSEGYQTDQSSTNGTTTPSTNAPACQHDLVARTPRSAPSCVQTFKHFHDIDSHVVPSFNYGYTGPSSEGIEDTNGSLSDDNSEAANDRERKGSEKDTGEGKFVSVPLKVGHGVAVLEESVELGVPDVVTQI